MYPFRLLHTVILRNYRNYGGESAARIGLFFVCFLLLYPVLNFVQQHVLPVAWNQWLFQQGRMYPRRSLMRLLFDSGPMLALLIPVFYFSYLTRTARTSQEQFNLLFTPIIERHPNLWRFPFTLSLAVTAVALISMLTAYPALSFLVTIAIYASSYAVIAFALQKAAA
jgi:hypothetical protein